LSTTLSKQSGGLLDIPGCKFRPVGLEITNELTIEQWGRIGHILKTVYNAGAWWWGDWYAYGERTWGELSSQATADLTGYENSSLRTLVWASSHVDLSIRIDKLSWSHHYQVAALEQDEQIFWLNEAVENKWTVKELKKQIRAAHKRLRDSEAVANLPADRCHLIQSDVAEAPSQIEAGSVDVIITDPPYPEEYLHVYEDLAKLAAHALKHGGSMLVMVGQSYLPQILESMTPHVRYHWTVSYLTPGGQAVQLWQRKVNTFWKPVLWFVKGEYQGDWVGDVSRSAVNDNDKRFHEWGQSESGMADLIERFSNPGDLILDPFLGGGTTGVVALKLDRQFIGLDSDADAVATASQRISNDGP
jgi:hypothetical protein